MKMCVNVSCICEAGAGGKCGRDRRIVRTAKGPLFAIWEGQLQQGGRESSRLARDRDGAQPQRKMLPLFLQTI